MANKIKENAFYYLDPPYHKTYSNYSNIGFNDEKHKQLAKFCKEIDKRGSFFMTSNSDTEFVRDIYRNYNIEEILARRSISRKGDQRKKYNELIIRNYK